MAAWCRERGSTVLPAFFILMRHAMIELILQFLAEIIFFKIGCWCLRIFSFGYLKWDAKGQGDHSLVAVFGFLMFVAACFCLYKLIER